ncbi:MAG TPA: TolC family protein [Terriglobales bacterium]|nr:TolC family protein [Terriglobales bacterium]
MRFLGRSLFSALGMVLALAGLAQAQTSNATQQKTSSGHAYSAEDYSKPKSHIFNFIAPFTAREVPPPNFSNSPRIDQAVRDGKIYISLSDAIALALENNLDIAIARFNLSIADTDILRSKAGASLRGVNTGVVSGTPGGGVGNIGSGATGGGAGGTSTGAGGAGAGSSGIVSSTLGGGPSLPSFDPSLSGTLSVGQSGSQSTNPFTGVPIVRQHTGTGNFSYNQGFATGTSLSVGFNNTRTSTNSSFNYLTPQLASNFRATVSQRLLQGLGWNLNTRNIRIAKNNREISDIAFRQQIISTVVQIQNIYWDLVNAYEDVKVKQESVALAEKTLADNQKQVEIGTLAPIEIVRAQSELAARNQDLIVSQTNLQLQQLLMKNAISRNLTDATLAGAPVIPTDTMSIPAVEQVVPTEDLINDALAHRPELASSRIDLQNRQISNKAVRNGLLPSVDVFAYYGASSVGGNINPNFSGLGGTATPNVTYPISYGGTFGNLFESIAPDKGIGLNIQIPIRNRAAQADQVRSELELQQAQMRLQQQQNQIRIDVRNSQFTLTQNRARVEAARKAVDLARESLDAEQKKYALGASTNTLVLQAQRDLTQSQSGLVSAMAAYEKSRVDLDRATGMTLTNYGIDIVDAESGNVKRTPQMPGVVPNTNVPGQQPVPQQQPNK